MEKATYVWRKLTPKQRVDLMKWRKQQGLPWHRPPHCGAEKTHYHLTAACYEHVTHIGYTRNRIEEFCHNLLNVFETQGALVHAWCVLPNHYHVLVETKKILSVLAELGRMHGRLSFKWNGEERSRGRQVWCGAVERYIRNDAHFWATMNYVHNNPVRNGYVTHWQDWPFSSAQEYLAENGKEFARQVWESIRSWIMEMAGMIRSCESEEVRARTTMGALTR